MAVFQTDFQILASGKKYRTIYADPPWRYSNKATRNAAAKKYPPMRTSEIKALCVEDFADKNAHLHLWTTTQFILQAMEVIEAWGFKYKSMFVWVKPQMGMGNYWRVSHELLLFGVRGKCPFMARNQKSWIEEKRTVHSKKPDSIRKIIEKVSPAPRIELFARKVVDGWDQFGNEVFMDV